MPAKITDMTKTTAETALSGFQQLFDQMKTQQASWTNYINIQAGNSFDLIRMLRSAFFMQAMTNKQLFVDYSDCVKINVTSLCSSLEKNTGLLIYSSESNINKPSKEYLYLMGTGTAILLKSQISSDWSDIYVLTFDNSLFEGSIKQMLHSS